MYLAGKEIDMMFEEDYDSDETLRDLDEIVVDEDESTTTSELDELDFADGKSERRFSDLGFEKLDENFEFDNDIQ